MKTNIMTGAVRFNSANLSVKDSKVLFPGQSKAYIPSGNQRLSLEDEWRGTEYKLLEVQCEVSSVGVIC